MLSKLRSGVKALFRRAVCGLTWGHNWIEQSAARFDIVDNSGKRVGKVTISSLRCSICEAERLKHSNKMMYGKTQT
jgi:hypothetical protein